MTEVANGVVAYIDVLGFSSLMRKGQRDSFFQQYLGVLERALEPAARDKVSYAVFSDSIVIYAVGEEALHLVAVVRAASRLYYEALWNMIPIRGAISYGSFTMIEHEHGQILAGAPLVEAIDCEKLQDWVGIMLAPSVMERNPHILADSNLHGPYYRPEGPESRKKTGSLLVQPWEIPFHDDNKGLPVTYNGFAVVPGPRQDETAEETVSALNGLRAKLNHLSSFAPTPGAQRKYAHAHHFLHNVQARIVNEIRGDQERDGKPQRPRV